MNMRFQKTLAFSLVSSTILFIIFVTVGLLQIMLSDNIRAEI